LLKEKSTGAITLAATKIAQSAAGATSDAVNSSLRASNDKRDFAATLMQIPRLEDSVVTTVIAESSVELRRERAIFKENVLVVNSESSHSSGVDPNSGGLSLAGGSSESATNTRSGEQSPGTYWISGDMKNAEMQLDGLGDGPVEVSISVHGNQAHVAFRTDESQTRDALEGAGGALRDMLHKEGMELSGVSIGTTASGDDSKQGRKHQPDSRALGREGFAVKFPVDAKSSVATRRVGGLDVFV
jgi:flagellar hook-length control protein FliK